MDLILAKGFDINVKTLRGSALHEAALCGKIEVVKSLLDNGINVEIRDDHDKTVLEVMDELKTQRTREVIHLILGKMRGKAYMGPNVCFQRKIFFLEMLHHKERGCCCSKISEERNKKQTEIIKTAKRSRNLLFLFSKATQRPALYNPQKERWKNGSR